MYFFSNSPVRWRLENVEDQNAIRWGVALRIPWQRWFFQCLRHRLCKINSVWSTNVVDMTDGRNDKEIGCDARIDYGQKNCKKRQSQKENEGSTEQTRTKNKFESRNVSFSHDYRLWEHRLSANKLERVLDWNKISNDLVLLCRLPVIVCYSILGYLCGRARDPACSAPRDY